MTHEDVLVLGELEARCLGRGRAGRVDRGEHRLELAAVDAAVGVDVVDQRLVRGLVVAEVVVEADASQRLGVDVGDADLDRVVGDARRRPGAEGFVVSDPPLVSRSSSVPSRCTRPAAALW